MGFVWNRTRQSPLLVLSRHIASSHNLMGLAVCHAEDIHALSGCMSLRAVQTTDSLLAFVSQSDAAWILTVPLILTIAPKPLHGDIVSYE